MISGSCNHAREDINLKASNHENAEPAREPDPGGYPARAKPPDESAFMNQAREEIYLKASNHKNAEPSREPLRFQLT